MTWYDGDTRIRLHQDKIAATMQVHDGRGGALTERAEYAAVHWFNDTFDSETMNPQLPEIAVLYWNGFFRIKPLGQPIDDDPNDPCYGSSFVLPLWLPVAQASMQTPDHRLHPVIEDLTVTLTADERPVFAATGSYYGGSCGEPLIAAAWTLELIEVTAFTSEWRLTADFMPPGGAPGYPELTFPAAGGFDGALGVCGISSMYADPQNFDADLFVAWPCSAACWRSV